MVVFQRCVCLCSSTWLCFRGVCLCYCLTLYRSMAKVWFVVFGCCVAVCGYVSGVCVCVAVRGCFRGVCLWSSA